MPFYEYKKHKIGSEKKTPDFIESAFNFWENNTDIGYIPIESNRDYYIPDTLSEVTMDDIVARCLRLKQSGVFSQENDTLGLDAMTDEELETWIRKKYQRFLDNDS